MGNSLPKTVMRGIRAAALGGLALWAAAAVAGPYDGVYVSNPGDRAPDPEACQSVPILIAGDRVRYHDVRCDLVNPVQIRDMDAVLYDGICRLDGTSKQGRVLIRRIASGDVALVTPFMDVRLAACRVAG